MSTKPLTLLALTCEACLSLRRARAGIEQRARTGKKRRLNPKQEAKGIRKTKDLKAFTARERKKGFWINLGFGQALFFCKVAEGKTVAMTVVAVPGVDGGAEEEEVAGVDAGVGVARPVVAVGTATGEVTGVPGEAPAPEEGERNIFYQSG